MSLYTVHAPPLRAAEASPDPERFVFIRDGFYLWAFLAAPLWMLRHRLWLALAIYLVIAVAFDAAMYYAGLAVVIVIVAEFFISLLAGIEGSTLRRITLARSGWKNIGVISGEDLEDAERRFFDAWIREPLPPGAASPAPAPSAPPVPRGSSAQDVIGLFPEPGASR